MSLVIFQQIYSIHQNKITLEKIQLLCVVYIINHDA